MNKPTAEDPAPCRGDVAFLSPIAADHDRVQHWCNGSKLLNQPACPFLDWCKSEREGATRDFGRKSVEGTWHGDLFVEGVVKQRGRRFVKDNAKQGVA